ncbi:MAG: aminotransferase class V-fold PLP-dependent enzyme, partial [Planctomycetota bacterium]|nr:aminotransferase class V-fold PLP-dependent enzyme [Planctomycetota bacterium]
NNEIGTLNDVHRLSGILSNSTIFHTDAAQALGKMDFNVHQSGIHLLSLSAHKIYGPKGIGALFVRRGTRLKPLWDGGGHERGKRSGTLNVSGIVGFAKAIQLLMDSREEEETRIRQLMGYCLNRMAQTIDHVKLNGPAIPQRLLGNLNFQIDGIDAETLALKIPDLCISTGSACTSADPEPSHVLQAIGLNEMQARSSIRIGIGRFNTEEDVECAVLKIAQVVRTLRP